MCLILLRPACHTRQQSSRLQSLGGASSSGGASSRVNTVSPPTQEMPKADFFVGKSFPIRWDPAKAKRPGSLSGEQYQVYSKSSTIGEMMAQGGRRHFDNDVRRGIFSFTESPWRDLQHRLQTDHVDEVRAQRTRIRSHVHASDHGGVSTSNSNSMPLSHQEQHELLSLHLGPFQFEGSIQFKIYCT